jgi:hypothetical protein
VDQEAGVLMAFLSFFLSPVGRWIGAGLAVLLVVGSAYTKGRVDGRASYKAKIERQIKDAVETGNNGRADALRQLDADGVPDNWLRD